MNVWTPAGHGAGPDSRLVGPSYLLEALGLQRLQKAHVTDRSSVSKDGWRSRGGVRARLEPYHHGGPHTELKPNPSKVKVEQQQRFRIKTSASIIPPDRYRFIKHIQNISNLLISFISTDLAPTKLKIILELTV